MKRRGFSMISLPFAESGFGMVLALPEGEPTTADDFANRMEESGGWATMVSRLQQKREKPVDIYIPRFTVRTRFPSLERTMQNLGAELLFDPKGADLGKMFSTTPGGQNVYVNHAMHETVVEVNEDGAEAAAAAAIHLVALGSGAPPPIEPRVFRADKPFAWAIWSPFGPLFMGWEAKPTYKSDA
jgi:serpin B